MSDLARFRGWGSGIGFMDVQVVWSIGLIVAAIALSNWQRLGLEGKIIIAAGRTVLQLAVLGYILAVVFAPPQSPILIGFVLIVLGIISAIVTRNQIRQNLPNFLPWVAGSLFLSTILTVGYVQWFVVQPSVWYEAQFLIPLAAIVLSHGINAGSIAGERLVSTLNTHSLEIETHLSLGATPEQAIAPYRKEAIRVGVLPTLNGMTIVGLATVPEILSGQLLGGANPVQATALQIVILFMLAFSTLLVTILITQSIWRTYFTDHAQYVRW
jgi:putative ABC transport system permease protein